LSKIKKYRKYSKKFKYETARRIIEEGHSLEEVARELEIQPKKLKQWKREYVRIMSMPDIYRHGSF
jgi:transposase-like protein